MPTEAILYFMFLDMSDLTTSFSLCFIGNAREKLENRISQTLVTRDGRITPSHFTHESLDCEKVSQYSRAGLALNPFGTASELDDLIFEGFTPHESLKNRWYALISFRIN